MHRLFPNLLGYFKGWSFYFVFILCMSVTRYALVDLMVLTCLLLDLLHLHVLLTLN